MWKYENGLMNLIKQMNWMNNHCIKTYSHSNSSISSSERSSSSLVRSWIFSLDDPSFKTFYKSGFKMCSNMSLSPSNARRCLSHARVVIIEPPMEHVKSTTRPFDGVNNSIRSCKKRGNFLYGPPPRFSRFLKKFVYFIHKIEKPSFCFSSQYKKTWILVFFVDFVVVKSLTKTWAINVGVYKMF
jgi:hypothetical protein